MSNREYREAENEKLKKEIEELKRLKEKQKAEIEELEKSVSRLALALEGARVAFWDHDFKTGQIYRSPLWTKMLRYEPGEIGSNEKSWKELIHPADLPEVEKIALDHENGLIPFFRVEHRLKTKNGVWKWILNWGKIIERDENDRPTRAAGIHLDITKRKEIEEGIARADKLESLGVLAGGIAHDFNNLLSVMMGNVSLAKLGSGKSPELLEELEKACFRARDLTQQMLTLARGGGVVSDSVLVEELVKACVSFALHGSNVKCRYDFPEDLFPIEADCSQIKQVINNILINADQSIPEGGVIEVKCRNINLKHDVKIPLEPGGYVEITIKDNGVGIPCKDINKVFDPFFTTKSNGHGLGLASAYSIIKEHKGHIYAESSFGDGSTFHVYLPVSEKKPTEVPFVDQRIITGTGKILVVDDEAAIRKMAEAALEQLGYEVDVVRDGDEAVSLFNNAVSKWQPYDAVILDLTIKGGKGGCEILEDIREVDKDIKAVVSSGYSDDMAISDYRKHGFNGRLIKPYKISKLSQTLSDLLSN